VYCGRREDGTLLAEILVEKTTALGMVKYIRCVLCKVCSYNLTPCVEVMY